MPECLFCKIVRGEIPALTVAEDDETMAFLDIHPRAPGHTVVISKHHSETLLDLSDDNVAALFRAVKTVSGRVLAALRADGATIGVNHGEVSGQVVPHLHVHILPRFTGDGGDSIQSVVSNQPKESLEEMVERIRKQK
ncbi:MAG: HIT family protein [Patescibacteria group bacterium]